MDPVPAAIGAAIVTTIMWTAVYIFQCAFSPVVRKGGKKRVRVGRLLFEHVMDTVRPDHQPATRKDT